MLVKEVLDGISCLPGADRVELVDIVLYGLSGFVDKVKLTPQLWKYSLKLSD